MATSNDAELQGRVLVLAPTARDADVTQSFLLKAGLACVVVPDLRTLGEELDKGAGATLLTDDVATAEATAEMLAVLRRQPTWSQPPFVVLMRGAPQSAVADALLRALGNVTVLDRPASMRTLASAVQSAVRGRLRQCQIRDQIEEIRRGEEAVRQSEARFRQLADSIPQLAWMAHPDGFIYWYNRRWYEYTGTTPGQMEGWGWQSVHHPTHLPRVMDQWKRAIATGTLFEMEFPLRAADGTFGWFLTRVVPLHDDAGRTVMWFGTNTDVTGQRRTADALRESEQRLRLAVHTARLGLWDLDLLTDTLTCSDGCKAVFGRAPGDPFTYDDFWRAVHPEDAPRVRDAIRQAIESRAEFETECRSVWPDGSTHWLIARAHAVHAPGGQALAISGVTLDITDRKRVEREREALLESERAARAEAERAGRMKDQFLATVSHELRTPLNAILGWSQILGAAPSDPDELSEGLGTIERNARSQAQLIDDLLDMSRITSGKLRLEMRSVDPAQVVQAAVETLRPTASAKGVALRALMGSPAGPVSADPSRLQQVVWNLLSNAVKFTPKGGKVEVLLERVESRVQITVSDTGEGIDPAFLPFMFERFRQADSSTTRRYGGLGLGLSIVKQLIELHGGAVTAHSAGKGKGSTFVLTLPLRTAEAAEDREPGEPRADAAKPEWKAVRLNGVRVLVVDDEPDARGLLKRMLEDCDAEVSMAASAAEALESLPRVRPMVIVSDIGMPLQDGYEFLRAVRRQGIQTPAVALTAFARPEDRLRALHAGYQMHLAKPVEPAELLAAVASSAGRLS